MKKVDNSQNEKCIYALIDQLILQANQEFTRTRLLDRQKLIQEEYKKRGLKYNNNQSTYV